MSQDKDRIQGPALYPDWYVNEKLEQLTKDPMTGLLNQETWRTTVENRLRSAESGKAKPAVLFLDITKFKALNDSHGHVAGDNFILAVAEMLRDSLRHEDTENTDLARVGGDEFAVLLDLAPRESDAHTPEERVQIVKSRIASNVAELINSRFPDYKSLGIDLAVGSNIWSPGDSVDEFIMAADNEMYESKKEQHELDVGSEAA